MQACFQLRTLAVLVMLPLLALTGCAVAPSCKAGTLFLTVQLYTQSAAATSFEVNVTFGATTKHGTLAHKAGATRGTIEVDFGGAYPSGQSAVIMLQALLGSTELGSGTANVTFSGACQAAKITVSHAGQDLGVDRSGHRRRWWRWWRPRCREQLHSDELRCRFDLRRRRVL